MLLNMLKGRIHRAVVTQAELDHVGSITIDERLMEESGIHEYEQVQVVDVDNGLSLEAYAITGTRDSGIVCLNGAAAHMVQPGDKVIIMAYALMTPEEADVSLPKVVFVDEKNRISRVTRYERHGRREDRDPLEGV
ncbi:aspartate 1-decarboxylase [uncultured Mailhella sp.]|uniref:aspartate 1-decarboxylase n=1 Tax=uncultured Mailhella sp. TaxID=1981031 RepID=UPI0025EE7BE2|nr:aspartate 1-decarboxylase [uncultured Mailhella sp.]